jgi:hypothetical protein
MITSQKRISKEKSIKTKKAELYLTNYNAQTISNMLGTRINSNSHVSSSKLGTDLS